MKYTKDFAKYYIAFQDNLSEDDKVALFGFISEAGEDDIRHLLHTGYLNEGSFERYVKTQKTIFNTFRTDIFKQAKELQTTTNAKVQGVYQQFSGKIDSALGDSALTGDKTQYNSLIKQRDAEVKKIWDAADKAKNELQAKLNAKAKLLNANIEKAKAKTITGKAQKVAQKIADKPAIKKLGKGIDKLQSNTALQKKAAIAAGSIVAAAAIATASYQIYKRYLSQAAKSCSGKKGAEKKLCMQQYRKKALQTRIQNMQSKASICNKTSNPEKCKQKIASDIKRLRSKL